MAAERAKHTAKADEIRANLHSQSLLLPAIVEANASFTGTRQAIDGLYEKQKKCM